MDRILGTHGGSRRLGGGEGWGVGRGYPYSPGRDLGRELCPSQKKKMNFSLEMACFGAL